MADNPILDFHDISPDHEHELRIQCLEGLKSQDVRRAFDAIQAVKWFHADDELLEALLELLDSSAAAMRALALDGLCHLQHPKAVGALVQHVHEYRQDEAESAHAMGALGQLATEGTLSFFERVIWEADIYPMDVRMRAVEALLQLCQRKVEPAGPMLLTVQASDALEPDLRETATAALKELHSGEWDRLGFATIEGEFETGE